MGNVSLCHKTKHNIKLYIMKNHRVNLLGIQI
jgi:hypothetical protein